MDRATQFICDGHHSILPGQSSLQSAAFIFAEQFSRRPSPRLILEINVRKLLTVVVAHDKAGGLFFDRPGRREAAGSFSDLDFSKSESFYDHSAYWPSSIQHLVQLAEL